MLRLLRFRKVLKIRQPRGIRSRMKITLRNRVLRPLQIRRCDFAPKVTALTDRDSVTLGKRACAKSFRGRLSKTCANRDL